MNESRTISYFFKTILDKLFYFSWMNLILEHNFNETRNNIFLIYKKIVVHIYKRFFIRMIKNHLRVKIIRIEVLVEVIGLLIAWYDLCYKRYQ
jgi:hypothetical protein